MRMDGYMKGTVKEFSDLKGNCQFQVDVERVGMMEALEIPAEFKKSGVAVWLKYSLQRRPAQCGSSQPIDIVDIKKRES